jgi:hypothetical protein
MALFTEQQYDLPLAHIHAQASFRERDFFNGKKTMDANRLIAALTEHVQRIEAEMVVLRAEVASRSGE